MKRMKIAPDKIVKIKFDEYSPSARLFKPDVYKEGDVFCCLLGPDLHTGVFGCGESPEEAINDWDRNLSDRVFHHNDSDAVAAFIIGKLKGVEV